MVVVVVVVVRLGSSHTIGCTANVLRLYVAYTDLIADLQFWGVQQVWAHPTLDVHRSVRDPGFTVIATICLAATCPEPARPTSETILAQRELGESLLST